MAAPLFQFQKTREIFVDVIKNVLEEQDLDTLEANFKDAVGSDVEKKTAMDQAFRDVLHELVVEDSACEAYKQMTSLATEAVKREMCQAQTPFVLLLDIFDGITLDKCADMFSCVEEQVHTWKSDIFYSAGKNYLLRMCNDLLRRLSKSQNTLFCGRIQLFLARLFPLSEKSGLNLVSQFNLENITVYSTDTDSLLTQRKVVLSAEETMEVDEASGDITKSSTIPIDYQLYHKFWSLQDFFRKPPQCYEKVPWKTFTNYAGEVLNCFESYKLDDMKGKKKQLEKQAAQKHTIFAKYLTSEKLLDLQLSDSNFRRYVLVQFLVLFQYLQAQIRFKNPNQVLSEDALTWVKNCTQKVYQLMKETPPEGEQFAKAIQHILNREENWNSWKNDNCPSFVRESVEPAISMGRGKKRSLGEDMKHGGKLIKMGSSELTRLWNLNRDNMLACSTQKRSFLPSLDVFFEDAIEQADPEAQMEDEYKLVNHPTWSWKALRLLSRSSPHFFTQASQTGKKLSEYLENTMAKMVTERGQENGSGGAGAAVPPAEENVKTNVGEEEDMREEQEPDKQEQEATAPVEAGDELVSEGQLKQLAELLQTEWKDLAHELNFPHDEVTYWEEENQDVTQQALLMLHVWKENEEGEATVSNLRHSLNQIGGIDIANRVFGEAK